MNALKAIERTVQQEIDWYGAHFKRRKALKKLKRQEIQLAEAIKIADQKARATRQKHWVVRDFDGTLLVLDRQLLITLKAHGKLNKRATGADFDRESLYVTQITNRRFLKGDGTDKEIMVKESVLAKFVRLVFGRMI